VRARPLADDALKIPPARFSVECRAAFPHVIDVEQPGGDARHDGPQPALALEERPIAQVLPSTASKSNA
jgi:hypothetical protein